MNRLHLRTRRSATVLVHVMYRCHPNYVNKDSIKVSSFNFKVQMQSFTSVTIIMAILAYLVCLLAVTGATPQENGHHGRAITLDAVPTNKRPHVFGKGIQWTPLIKNPVINKRTSAYN